MYTENPTGARFHPAPAAGDIVGEMHRERAIAVAAALILSIASICRAEVIRVGDIDSPHIPEASGLACSQQPDRLWIINDGGSPPALHAVGRDGALHGEVAIDGVQNHDWEDLATYVLDGRSYLIVADIGDNEAQREFVSLHVLEEPDPLRQARTVPLRTLRFRYPNGPQDAESIAVDAGAKLVYVLTKRSIPAELYTVPLTAEGSEPVVARFLGTVASLPQPSAADVRNAPRLLDWYWQPTAMDFAADGSFASILTYRATYTYARRPEQSWFEALGEPPTAIALTGVLGAEALCAAPDGDLYVTVEADRPPLYRVRRGPAPEPL